MSYQVLARKWRPTNFSEVAGQGHVLQSLINALDKNRLHHAYLFTGTRGVGKTTLARILAKCLNCETGISSRPCGECDSCREINEGRFVDLIEVDAASRTKVEDTRDLLENVQYTPTRGRYKVYLIDEVHMLSNHSFNALLKTLEEPPEHVKFLFATTDPQKLPVTILSRCLQFNLKNLSPAIIVGHLETVLTEEGIEFEEPALWQIAAAAAGSMRDGLTLTDQAIAYCEGKIGTRGVIEMLGIPEQSQVYAMLHAMAKNNAAKLLELAAGMAEQSPDYTQALDSLLSALHRIALAQVSSDAVDNSFGDRKQIIELAASLIAEDVQLFYQIGSRGREELRLATDLRSAFEMLLLRMLLFSPNYSAAATEDGPSPAPVPEQQPAQADEKKKTELRGEALPEPGPEVHQEPSPARNPEPSPEQVRASAPGNARNLPASLDNRTWLRVFPQLDIKGMAANVLANTAIKGASEEAVALILDASQSAVYSEDLLGKFAAAFSDFYGCRLAVELEVAEVNVETPARQAIRLREERHEQMVAEFEQDENVQELLKRFSGRIAPESISPLED